MALRGCFSILIVLSLVGLSCTRRPPGDGPPYAKVRSVVERHCIGCHSEHTTIPAFPLAPKDIKLDTGTEMRQHAELMQKTVVVTRTMPLLNKTGMTEDERALLDAWVQAGARLE